MQPMSNNPQIYSIPALQYQYQYNNVLPGITSRRKTWLKATMLPALFGGDSVGFESDDSSFKRMRQPLQNPKQIIATVTPSSGTASSIVLTWNDTSYDNFRIDDVISDGNTMVEGRITQHSPGQVTLEVQPGSPYFDLSKDFLAGTEIFYHYNRSITFNSGGTENRFWVNETQLDYSDITNNTLQLARNEKIYSYVGVDGNIYVWNQHLENTTNDHMRQVGFKYWFSKGGKRNGSKGLETSTVGIRSRIIQDGKSFTSSTLGSPLDIIIDMGRYMASKNGTEFQSFLFGMGRDFMIALQQDPTIKGMVTHAGQLNTLGGKDVRGLNVQTFTIGNMQINWVLLPFLSDTQYLADWQSYSCYGLDLTPIPTLGSGSPSQSPMIKIHRGMGDEASSTIQSYVGGKQGMGSSLFKNVLGTSGAYRVTSSNIDGETWNMQTDSGISLLADNFTLFEKR